MKKYYLKIVFILVLFFNANIFYSQNSLNFDGVYDYVSIPNGGSLNNLQTGTIELWVKWNTINQDLGASSNTYGAIMARQNDGVVNNQILALNTSNPNTAKIIWKPYYYTSTVLTSISSPLVNTWIHIAIVYASGNHKMYINGNLEATSAETGVIANNTVPLTLGAWIDDGNSYSNSNIDEFRVWNIARTASEITDNMNKELIGNETNLITYYNFNQGIADGDNSTETILNDSSINNFNGTLINFALSGTISNWTLGINFNALSINKNNSSNSLFYVNNNTLYIKNIQNLNDIKNIEVYNLLGQQVFKTLEITEQIQLNILQKGIYILKVEDKNSNYNTLKFLSY